jgi:hypothetical protein
VVAAATIRPTARARAAITGASLSLVWSSLAVVVMNRGRPGAQGAALGAYGSFWDLGAGLAGPLTGALAAWAEDPLVFAGAAAHTGHAHTRARPTAERGTHPLVDAHPCLKGRTGP